MPFLKVLLSHAHEEKALAEAWKEVIQATSMGAIDTWFSSDTASGGGIELGQEWRANLYDQIAASDFIIAIQTPISDGRPWIMWESGIASGVDRVRAIIPVVYAMGRGDLANPLNSYQVYQGQDRGQVCEVCERLATEAGLTPRSELYAPALDAYMETINLHRPRKPIGPERMVLWRERFEELVQTGRVEEVPSRRTAMYASLDNPFEPIEPTVHELLSRILLEQKDYQGAIEEADYALRLVGEDAELIHRKALAMVELQNLSDAETLVQGMFQDHNELRSNPELASLEGRINRERWTLTRERTYLDAAFNAYHRAYEADRNQYFPGINAGELALVRGDILKAEEIFREVLETCSMLQQRSIVSYWVDFSAGQAYIGLGDTEAAVGEYTRALSRIPAPPPRARQSALGGARRTAQARGLSDASIQQIAELLDGS